MDVQRWVDGIPDRWIENWMNAVNISGEEDDSRIPEW